MLVNRVVREICFYFFAVSSAHSCATPRRRHEKAPWARVTARYWSAKRDQRAPWNCETLQTFRRQQALLENRQFLGEICRGKAQNRSGASQSALLHKSVRLQIQGCHVSIREWKRWRFSSIVVHPSSPGRVRYTFKMAFWGWDHSLALGPKQRPQ